MRLGHSAADPGASGRQRRATRAGLRTLRPTHRCLRPKRITSTAARRPAARAAKQQPGQRRPWSSGCPSRTTAAARAERRRFRSSPPGPQAPASARPREAGLRCAPTGGRSFRVVCRKRIPLRRHSLPTTPGVSRAPTRRPLRRRPSGERSAPGRRSSAIVGPDHCHGRAHVRLAFETYASCGSICAGTAHRAAG